MHLSFLVHCLYLFWSGVDNTMAIKSIYSNCDSDNDAAIMLGVKPCECKCPLLFMVSEQHINSSGAAKRTVRSVATSSIHFTFGVWRDTGVRCNEVSWDTVSNKPIKARRRQPSNAMAPACNCHHHTAWWDLKGCCSGITEMQFGILSKDMKYNSRGAGER